MLILENRTFRVALLGYPLWQARYGGDPGIVGRTVMINDVSTEVTGVMPEGFRLPTDFTNDLLLVRGDARVREMALRTAIGAAPDRLVRQLLTESVVLAVLGAALGLALAAVGLRALVALDPTSLPPLAPVRRSNGLRLI